MSKTIDYYLTLNSPWTYLGSQRLEAMAAKNGAAVTVNPVDYSVIFPQTGGLPLPKRAPARQAYRLAELQRWSAHLDMPITLHPKHFPTDERLAAGCVVAAGDRGGDPLRLAHRLLRAVWVEELDIAEPATIERALAETGHDAAALMAAGAEAEPRRQALTQQALERGVFGAPSYLLGDALFWGQDRLDFLERALAAA